MNTVCIHKTLPKRFFSLIVPGGIGFLSRSCEIGQLLTEVLKEIDFMRVHYSQDV